MTGPILFHGIVRAGQCPDWPDLILSIDAFDAIASPFGQEIDPLGTPEGVETWLRRHDALLSELVARGADVAPARFGSCFSGPAALRRELRRNAAAWGAALDTVAGHYEWSIVVEDAADPREEVPSARSGADFLRQKRALRDVARGATSRRTEIAHKIVRISDSTARRVAPMRADPGRRLGVRLLLNSETQAEMLRHLQDLSEEADRAGLSLTMKGPYPPYAFAGEVMIEPEAADA